MFGAVYFGQVPFGGVLVYAARPGNLPVVNTVQDLSQLFYKTVAGVPIYQSHAPPQPHMLYGPSLADQIRDAATRATKATQVAQAQHQADEWHTLLLAWMEDDYDD